MRAHAKYPKLESSAWVHVWAAVLGKQTVEEAMGTCVKSKQEGDHLTPADLLERAMSKMLKAKP